MEALELLGIRVLSSIKLLNSLLENTVHNRTVFCSESIEQGEIHLKIKKGLISAPRELSFKIPPYATIIEDEHVGVISCKVAYDDKKGSVSFINCSNLGPNQEVHDFQFHYKRAVDWRFISSCIECIEMDVPDGKKVTVKNNSDIEFINYLVKCRMSLPRQIISDFENLKETPEEIIKVHDNVGEKIESFIGNIFMKGEIGGSSSVINLYGDICWHIDLNPNEKKIFRLCSSKIKGKQC